MLRCAAIKTIEDRNIFEMHKDCVLNKYLIKETFHPPPVDKYVGCVHCMLAQIKIKPFNLN